MPELIFLGEVSYHGAPFIACSLPLLVSRWQPSYIKTVKSLAPCRFGLIWPHVCAGNGIQKNDLWALPKLHDMLIFWYGFNVQPQLLLNLFCNT